MTSLDGRAVLVTGATGFIGEHAVRRLAALGARCGALVRREPDVPFDRDVTVHRADLLDADALPDIVRRYDSVVHLSGRTGAGDLQDPIGDVQANTLTTVHVLKAAAATQARRVVVASSYEVYGPPRSVPIDETHPTQARRPYAASVLARESYADAFRHAFGVPATVLRFFTVYGPAVSARNRKGVVAAFLDRLARGEALKVTGQPWDRRDFVFVDDVVDSLAAVLATDATIGEVLNVGRGESASVADVVRLLAEHFARPELWTRFEAEHPEVPGTEVRADVSRLRRLTGYAPSRSLAAGIRAMAETGAEAVAR